jgi:hypothetical protein
MVARSNWSPREVPLSLMASFFVGKPLNILLVALALFAVHFALWWTGRQSRSLLVAAGGWALYAAWEWLVRARTPDADIRVDLLLIWPILAIVTVWCIYRAFR